MAAQRYRWTPEADAILREEYNSGIRGRSKEIARRLGFPIQSIKRRASALALAAPQPRHLHQTWAPAEIAIVEEWSGQRSVPWIVKRLKAAGFSRSLTAVIVRQKRMQISRRIAEGYTMRDLELALGVDHRRIERLVREGKLRGTEVGARSMTLPTHRWHFSDSEVLAFLRDHQTSYRLDRVDQPWFLGLVFDVYAKNDLKRKEHAA